MIRWKLVYNLVTDVYLLAFETLTLYVPMCTPLSWAERREGVCVWGCVYRFRGTERLSAYHCLPSFLKTVHPLTDDLNLSESVKESNPRERWGGRRHRISCRSYGRPWPKNGNLRWQTDTIVPLLRPRQWRLNTTQGPASYKLII